MATLNPGTTSNNPSSTNVLIEGVGVSIAFMRTDQESFELLTETGINEFELQELMVEIEADGRKEEGLLVDKLKVAVNDQIFTCSWDKIRNQLTEQCLLPQQLYENLKVGEYLLVLEKRFEALTEEIGVKNYRPDMLRFNVEHVEPSKGDGYLLMDFSFNGDALTYASTYSEDTDVCIVDRQGLRHEIKLNYG